MNYQNCHKTKSNLNRKRNKTKKKFIQIEINNPGQKSRTSRMPQHAAKKNDFSLYDARVLATLGKIIVVTFNYRIGVLGKNQLCQYLKIRTKMRYRKDLTNVFETFHECLDE